MLSKKNQAHVFISVLATAPLTNFIKLINQQLVTKNLASNNFLSRGNNIEIPKNAKGIIKNEKSKYFPLIWI